MAATPIDDKHHVLRHVKGRLLERDDQDNVLGVFPESMKLRHDEKYLSASYYEHFAGTHDDRLRASLASLRTRYAAKGTDALVMLSVGEVKKCGSEKDVKLRVLHEPTRNKPDYAAIRGIPNADQDELAASLCALAIRDVSLIMDFDTP